MSSKQVFISYAWGGLSEEVANELESLFTQQQIGLTRDKTDLGFKGLIKEFMQEIGQGNLVILIISDKYLKSKNCMFELLKVEKKGEFYDRIFPIILPDANIYDSLGMIGYLKYWDQKIKELNQSVKELDNLADTRKIQEDINLYTDIRGAIDDLAAKLSNMNTLSLELLRAKNFEPLLEALKAKLSPSNPDLPKKKEGKVLYHIPGMMQVEKWTRCMVRLAWDEILLQENLAIPEEERIIEPIRLGQIMQVSLIQGKGGDNFEIQALNNEEQFISEDDFTEWLFEVKPLSAGKFSLILRISLIQIIDGKERKKDLVLEREVTAEAVVPQALPKFETAESGLSIAKENKEKNSSAIERIIKPKSGNVGNALPVDSIPRMQTPSPAASPGPASSQKTPFLKKVLPYAASITVILLAAIILFPTYNSEEQIGQAPDVYLSEEPNAVGSPPPSLPLGDEKVLIAMSIESSSSSENSEDVVLIFSMETEDYYALQQENLAGIILYPLETEDTLDLKIGTLKTATFQEVKDSLQVIRRIPADRRPINPDLQKIKVRSRINY